MSKSESPSNHELTTLDRKRLTDNVSRLPIEIPRKGRQINTENITIKPVWTSDYDQNRFLTQVHMPFKKILGVDFKLAKFTPQEQEFILDMVQIGMMAVDIVPDPDIGQDIKEMDFGVINTLAILRFNVEGNVILNRLTKWEEPEKQVRHEDLPWVERLRKRVSGESKPKVEEIE